VTSLSTHVLDTTRGTPAARMGLRLFSEAGLIWQGVTDGDGRCGVLPHVDAGRYRLEFDVAAYFRGCGLDLPEPPFLDIVRLDFGVTDDGHYHVPLLVSPFGYSTYRGS